MSEHPKAPPVFDTSCKKCGAEIKPLPAHLDRRSMDYTAITVTGYRCNECGHYNDLKRRKGFSI